MNQEDYPATIFDHMRVRSLVLWIVPGVIIVIIAGPILHPFGGLFLTIWPLFWLRLKLGESGTTFHAFIGRMPNQRQWSRWILVTMGLLAFSVGCLFLVWYPLSFVYPRLVELLILSDRPFFFDDGTLKPFHLLVLELTLGIIVAPFAEELLFRGVILQRWATKWGMKKSIVLSSLIFGFLHVDPVGKIFFGFVMAVLYIRTRTLLVPIFCHALNNATVYILVGIDVSMTGTIETTIDQFRSSVWIGIICLLVTAPWAMSFGMKYWPRGECPIPYSPEPIGPVAAQHGRAPLKDKMENFIKNYSESIWIAPIISFVLFVLLIATYHLPPIPAIIFILWLLSVLGHFYSIIYKLFKRLFIKSIVCAALFLITVYCFLMLVIAA